MNKRHLSYFMEVYRTGSIQAAADKLYISRQGLSKTIRSIEEKLGQSLFTRTASGLKPTEFSDNIAPRIQKILDEYEAIEKLSSFNAQESERLCIYSFAHIPAFLGVDFIKAFRLKHPNIALSFVEAPDDVILSKLESCGCDLAIINGPIDHTKYEASELFFSRFCLRMSCRNSLSSRKIISPADLNGCSIAGNGRAYRCFREALNKYLILPGYSVDVPVETSDEQILRQLAKDDIALVASYDYQFNEEDEDIIVRYFDDESLGSYFYLVENREVAVSKAGQAFKDFLINWMKNRT